MLELLLVGINGSKKLDIQGQVQHRDVPIMLDHIVFSRIY